MFPDAVSAQQQLFTSSLCAAIFTVLRSARRSYTNIFPLPPATTSLPSAEKRQLQIPNVSSSKPHIERDRRGGSAKRMGIWVGEESRVLVMYTVGVIEEYIMRSLSGLRCESVIVHRPELPWIVLRTFSVLSRVDGLDKLNGTGGLLVSYTLNLKSWAEIINARKGGDTACD